MVNSFDKCEAKIHIKLYKEEYFFAEFKYEFGP